MNIFRWRGAESGAEYSGEHGNRKLRPVCDSPSSASLNFISEKAAAELKDIWDSYATLYPVVLDDTEQNYYMHFQKPRFQN